jgi:hypothetical protein
MIFAVFAEAFPADIFVAAFPVFASDAAALIA